MPVESRRLDSVCVYCGSSNAADPSYSAAAETLGRLLADANIRLVYGGGGVGLMGAVARGAHAAGGRVLGIMPSFLINRERAFDDVETVIVETMHERKMMMFEQSDGFIVLPGGVGTLEEIVELLSWRRLDLHSKPIAFWNPDAFWTPLFALFDHTVATRFTPRAFEDAWRTSETVEGLIPALRSMTEPTVMDDRAVTDLL